MRFDEHFAMRKLIGTKLKDYIRSNGFSKVSFCMKTEISRTTSRPTLDKVIPHNANSRKKWYNIGMDHSRGILKL